MKTLYRMAPVLGALMALAACDDDGTGVEVLDQEALDQDVALLAADAAAEDLAVMSDMLQWAGLGGPEAMARDLYRSRSVEFFDAEGLLQDAYDALTTASIHTVLEIQGEVERMNMEMSLSRTRDMWVTGLEGEETTRTWNGTGTEAHSRVRVSDTRGTRTYDMEGTLLVEDVVRPVPLTDRPWPLSGTITRTVTVEVTGGPDGDRTVTRTVVITFSGERIVTLTVNGVEYELDLAAQDRDRVRRRVHD
ncbi:MAG TPA: hypothetical protein VK858_18730 [Longimicrobiales bacterium]|nr:hypothetical protein [Longimicrobiales bacterium]